MVWNTNLSGWLSGGTRSRELKDTHRAWNETQAAWRASPLGQSSTEDRVRAFITDLFRRRDRVPDWRVVLPMLEAADQLFTAENAGAIEAEWDQVEGDMAVAVRFRQMLVRRKRYATSFSRTHGAVVRQLAVAFDTYLDALPEACFREWPEDGSAFEVPLIELIEEPAAVVERMLVSAYDDDTLGLELFLPLRERYALNLLIASGFPPTAGIHDVHERLILPTRQRGKSGRELVDLYFSGTPFAALFEIPVPLHIPDTLRFEHAHIIGGTGHGKTQLLQRMIHADLLAARDDGRAVVVIDSQGDLINKLVRLDLFDPNDPRSLADRLILIDPADVEFPAALNLFDAHLDRLREYRPVDRERVLNGVVELYEVFFGALLGAELTQKQGVIFKYLARLMLTIPGATIHTLMQLMEDGKPFREHMRALDGSARYFFETEFFHPSFAATKRQILKRLWGVLATPAFERMFAQRENKLDLFGALQNGKIVLINTAKDLLKEEGSQLFGRFFIALLAQAALERSTVGEDERTPTFVYVDEAQEYFDDRIETILTQARKYKVGITLAHQTLDQLSPRLRAAIHANTSLKCAGGVSARDARALADELHTRPEFIESMKRRQGRTEFALWMKHETPEAIRLSAPLGFLEGQPILDEEAFEALIVQNRLRYCGTLDDVLNASSLFERAPPEPAEAAPPSEPRTPLQAPVETAPPVSEADVPPTPRRPPPRAPESTPEPGKGGPQHRYLQHLVKQLAEERGLRVIVEEAVPSGQVDVGLHQGELSIACEISVSSTPEYEAQNLAKCLNAGFSRVWAIAPDAKRRRAIKQHAEARLDAEDSSRVEFLTTEELIEAMDGLQVPEPEEKVVKGYRLISTRKAIPPAEAKERRASIARILSQSLRETER